MCGPLNAFVALDPAGTTDPSRVARYHLGRLVGYGAFGAVFGSAGAGVRALVPSGGEAVLSLVLALSLALAAFQIWPRGGAASPRLVALAARPRGASWLERASRGVAALLGRVRRFPLVLGAASALLPCGVIAAGALLAAGTGHALTGALAMLGLAIASGAGLAIAGMALGRAQVTRSAALARAMAVTLALGALVLVSRPAWSGTAADAPSADCH